MNIPFLRPAALIFTVLLVGCTSEEKLDQILSEVAALRSEVSELSKKVDTAPPARPAGRTRPTKVTNPINIGGYPSMGEKDAPVTMVEFSDYQCPFCRRHTINTLPRIKADFIKTGKLRYVFVDNAILSHKQAPKASEAAHCAGEQDRYWDMHAHLFENQRRIRQLENLPVFAKELGLDEAAFNACLTSGRHKDRVDAGHKMGIAIGATGTPSFVIGKTRADGMISGDMIVGAKAFTAFESSINRFLNP